MITPIKKTDLNIIFSPMHIATPLYQMYQDYFYSFFEKRDLIYYYYFLLIDPFFSLSTQKPKEDIVTFIMPLKSWLIIIKTKQFN